MANANSLILKATYAAQAHERTTGHYSYAFQVGVLEGLIHDLCRQLNEYLPRATGKNEYETTYAGEFGEYVVYFDASEGSPGSWDEPAEPAEVIVNAVFANGFDVMAELDQKVFDRITEHCYEVAEQMAKDSKADADIERYESSREDRWAA